MKGKKLNVEDISNLCVGDTVWIEYISNEDWDLEYCKLVPINTFIKDGSFIDKDGNEFDDKEDLIDYMNSGSIEVFLNVSNSGNPIKCSTLNYYTKQDIQRIIEEVLDDYNIGYIKNGNTIKTTDNIENVNIEFK